MMNKDINGLTLFVESACADHRLLQRADSVEIRESLERCPMRIRESVHGGEPSGWWVPISFYNKVNGNNRNYNRRLWENVMSSQKATWCGSPMLCDHPAGDSDGNPKDICGVWLDMKLGEPDRNGTGLVYGLLMPSGHHGDDLQDHLRNGLKIGTSSSGFGKLSGDGVTVDPDTYMIERLADWVLSPSQGTFFSYDESSDEVVNRSLSESIDRHEFADGTLGEEHIKETCVKDSKLTRLEEKKFRRDMESFLESANSIVDPQERLEEFKDIRSYFEDGVCPDLKEKVESKIAEQEAEIKRMLAEHIEMKEELNIDSVKDLKEKLTKVAEDFKVTESEAKDWKEISEKLQGKLTEARRELDDRPTQGFVKYQKEQIDKLRESLDSHDSKAVEIVRQLTEAYKGLKASKDEADARIAEATELSESLGRKVEAYGRLMAAQRGQIEEMAKKQSLLEGRYAKAIKEIKVLKELLNKNRELFMQAHEYTGHLEETTTKAYRQINALKGDLREAEGKVRVKEAAERRASAAKAASEMSEPEKFYESLVETYGDDVRPYRKAIAGAVTLSEAKNVFYKKVLGNLKESRKIDDMRLPESMAISPEERSQYILKEPIKKTSSVDRLPEGWV